MAAALAKITAPRGTRLNPFTVLSRHYHPSSRAFEVLVTHSVLVTRKAQEIALAYLERVPDAEIDLEFLVEASMLHDIGIVRCDAPEIGCNGDEPYIRHGVLGREILEAEGLMAHALTCERHTGAGITADEVREQSLPIPERDYLPETIEEKIICVADKFYSKNPTKLWHEKSLRKIARGLSRYGADVALRWKELSREILGESDDDATL
jgi:uncharacterized protein